MVPKFVVIAVATLSLSLAPQKTAQDQPQPIPRFRVGVDVVPFDVSVLDGKGNPVLDLQPSDFTIFEDGVEQEIVHFSLEEFATGSDKPTALPTAAERPPMEGLRRPAFRRFLIVLGRGEHETFQPIAKLADFVRDSLGPADEVAVIAYNRATDFTTDHARIAEFLDRFQELNTYVDRITALRFSGLASVFGSRRFPPSLQPKIDELFDKVSEELHQVSSAQGTREGADPEVRENLMAAMRGAMPARLADAHREFEGPNAGQRWDGSGPAPYGMPSEKLDPAGAEDDSFEENVRHRLEIDQDLLNIFAGIEYLRYLEGEKHLIYFSSAGLFLPKPDNRESLAQVAADARVRIDTFKTEGVFLKLSDSRRNRFAQGSFTGDYAIRSLQEVARETGGTSCIHRNVDDALELVGKATSRVYLLGYVSKNPNLDGRFREIKVKVDRQDLRVLARSGYYARPRLQPYDRDRMIIYARVTAAAEHPGNIDDLPFAVSISDLHRREDSLQFDISFEFSPGPAPANQPNDDDSHKFVVGLFLLDRKGELVETRWRDITLRLSKERGAEATPAGLVVGWPVEVARKIESGYLKVVLYDPASDRVGSRVERIH